MVDIEINSDLSVKTLVNSNNVKAFAINKLVIVDLINASNVHNSLLGLSSHFPSHRIDTLVLDDTVKHLALVYWDGSRFIFYDMKDGVFLPSSHTVYGQIIYISEQP